MMRRGALRPVDYSQKEEKHEEKAGNEKKQGCSGAWWERANVREVEVVVGWWKRGTERLSAPSLRASLSMVDEWMRGWGRKDRTEIEAGRYTLPLSLRAPRSPG